MDSLRADIFQTEGEQMQDMMPWLWLVSNSTQTTLQLTLHLQAGCADVVVHVLLFSVKP